jgi:hypothetical protein
VPGVLERGLNVTPRKFRVTAQQRIPGFNVGQLFQDDGHGNSCAFDDWLAATHSRIDFNTLAHAQSLAALDEDRKHPATDPVLAHRVSFLLRDPAPVDALAPGGRPVHQ